MPRSSFGRVGARKVWVGQKSVNVRLDRDQALLLAAALTKGAFAESQVTMAVFTAKVQKKAGGAIPAGTTPVTVSGPR